MKLLIWIVTYVLAIGSIYYLILFTDKIKNKKRQLKMDHVKDIKKKNIQLDMLNIVCLIGVMLILQLCNNISLELEFELWGVFMILTVIALSCDLLPIKKIRKSK